MKISAINLYSPRGLKNNAQKNNLPKSERNASPAFKGHTEEPLLYKSYDNVSFNILGKRIDNSYTRYSTTELYAAPSEVADSLAKSIVKYNREYDRNRYFDKTANNTDTKLYIADPNEKITEEIRKKHSYIVYDNEPSFPTFKQLENKYTSTSQDTHNYYKDVTDYIEYQKRVIETEKKNIEKAKKFIDDFPNNNEEIKKLDYIPAHLYSERYNAVSSEEKLKIKEEEKNILVYQKRMNQAKLKAGYAQNIYNLLCRNGDDFVQRDILVKNYESLKDSYIRIDDTIKECIRLKDVNEKQFHEEEQELKELKELKAESYYTRSEIIRIEESVKSRKRYVINSEKEIENYKNFKQTAPQKLKAAQDELNSLLNKMGKDFETLKKYYIDNNLDLL